MPSVALPSVAEPAASGVPEADAEAAAWQADPDGFWMRAACDIDWVRPPDAARRMRPDGMADWFPGGVLNTCANALDRHVAAGRGEQAAILWDSPASGASLRLSYAELLRRVAGFAGGLRALGVEVGDRVLIALPPVPEAVVAMLAAARLGAVHVVVFAGFAAAELARRIDDTAPVVVIGASCGFTGTRPVPLLPALAEALAACRHRPRATVVLQRPAWSGTLPGALEFRVLEAAPTAAPVPVPSGHPLYVLHTSGTTGQPKGVVRDNGGHAVALCRSMHAVYGVEAGEVFCTTADPGWVVGHSYAVYGPLLAGCTSVLFEGAPVGTPDAGTVWRLCARHRVRVLFTAPGALRAARGRDPAGALAREHDLSALRAIFVAGERIDAAVAAWAERAAGVPVHDNWWQTETGWAIAAGRDGLRPSPGFRLEVRAENGASPPPGGLGELLLRLPLPPGCLSGLWQADGRMRDSYLSHPGCYRTFDLGTIDEAGRVAIVSRSDDVVKVSGRRIACGRIEEVIAAHPLVADCAVVGVADLRRGQVPVGFVVPAGIAGHEALHAELVTRVRTEIGALACLRRIVFVDALPRTRSGKILRRDLTASIATSAERGPDAQRVRPNAATRAG